MLSAFDVAYYILAQADDEAGDLISNLKLQKLLYYSQGFFLAVYDEPLFKEPIEAWTHGPVVPSVYREFKKYGSCAIEPPKDMDFGIFDDRTAALLDEVYAVYGQFSAWKLRNMTHEEPPWKNYRNSVIPHSALKEYFTTQLN
jgi:uncharacterized phage-associated protein